MKFILRILKFTKELWPFYVIIVIFNVLVAFLNQLQPIFTKGIIDELLKLTRGLGATQGKILLFVLFIVIAELMVSLLTNVGGYIGDLMSSRMNRLLSDRYYKHMLSMPQSYFDTELSGKITARLNRSIAQVTQFMNMMANNFGQFILTSVFSLIIVSYYSWQVGLLLLSLYPIFLWLTMRTSEKWQKYQGEKNTHQDIAYGRFQESISQVKVVKSYAQESRELKFFSKHMKAISDLTKPQSRYWHIRDNQRNTILNLVFGLVYGVIGWQAFHGQLTPSEAVLLIQYGALIRIPLFTITFLVENTQRAIADSKDYFEAMSLEPEIKDRPTATSLSVKKGEIKFDHVDFGYTTDSTVLHDITFDIKPDTRIALVGESGEGKTTLTNLLLRLYEPRSGTILIDGQDIADVTQASLRGQIGVVFQDPSLFSGSIRENISYANPKATETEIIAAAKAANAHEFISKFEKGYDTEIGERGLKLSGGQKQRIAIARALLKDAPILVLDEATSSLDSRSEAMVQEALERLMKNRTTIIIAHRLSTIQSVDQIVTIKNGRIDEIGSPEELSRTDGIYAQLLQLQNRKTESAKESLKKFELAA